jgi:hypothetical protein
MLIFCKFCFCLVDSENIVCQKRYLPHKKYSCCINGKPDIIVNAKKNVKTVKKKSTATQTTGEVQEEFNDNMDWECKLLLGLSKPTLRLRS